MYWELHQSKYTKMELKFYIQMFLHKNHFWRKILRSKVEALGFLGFCATLEISPKYTKNLRIDLWWSGMLQNPPKTFFRTSGDPCGQNEPYISLIRPFLMNLYTWEISLFQADFPKIAFSVIFENVTSWEKNQKNLGNHFSHQLYF